MHFLGKKYYKPNVSPLELDLESYILDGSITNANMMVNTVTVDVFDDGGIETLDFDANTITP